MNHHINLKYFGCLFLYIGYYWVYQTRDTAAKVKKTPMRICNRPPVLRDFAHLGTSLCSFDVRGWDSPG